MKAAAPTYRGRRVIGRIVCSLLISFLCLAWPEGHAALPVMSPASRQGEYKYRICFAAQVEISETTDAKVAKYGKGDRTNRMVRKLQLS
jgi:hypothetical protein